MTESKPQEHFENELMDNALDEKALHATDRNRNAAGIVQNPLSELSESHLAHLADTFTESKGLVEYRDLFRRAAIASQNPLAYETVPGLTSEDRQALTVEAEHKWKQSRAFYYTVVVCSITAAIQGWDITGANGAQLSFPVEFGIASNTWLIGMINSAPSLITGLGASYLCDPCNKYFGRRGTIFITAVFCTAPALCQAFTRNWYQLFACRALLGIGVGLKVATVPIMLAEIAPSRIRGAVMLSMQMWIAFGILLGFSSNLIFMNVGRNAWRIQLGASFAPAVPMLLLIWFCPESPRWLMKKDRYPKAFRSLQRLRLSDLQAARDLFYAHFQILEEEDMYRGTTFFSRFAEIFTKPRLRRATIATLTCVTGREWSGINIIAFYSSTIFTQAGYTTEQALLASFGYGMVNFLGAFPGIWTLDTFGRRNLMLFTYPIMSLCLIWGGSMFYMDTENSARVPVIVVAIYLFALAYSPGLGPVAFTYAAESYPLTHREVGTGLAMQVNFFWAAVLSLTFPTMLLKFGAAGAFYFYAGTNILGLITTFLFIPETKQLTLEELDFVFAVPTSRFVRWNCFTWLPYLFRKYFLFQKDQVLEPLYSFKGVSARA